MRRALALAVLLQACVPALSSGDGSAVNTAVPASNLLVPTGDPAGLGALREVIAEGSAPIRDGDRSAARNEAIQQALRAAVQSVAGVTVSAATLLEKLVPVMDRVYVRSEGYAVPCEVIEERWSPVSVTLRMRVLVRAHPLPDPVSGKLSGVGAAVVLRADASLPGSAASVQAGVTNRLVAAGLAVGALPPGIELDLEALLNALRAGEVLPPVEVLVVGALSATEPSGGSAAGSRTPLPRARLSLTAFRVATGCILGEATAEDPCPGGPVADAVLDGLGRRTASELLDAIAGAAHSAPQPIRLVVRGFVRRAQATAFETGLREVAGVRRVGTVSYADRMLSLDVVVEPVAAAGFAARLEHDPALKGLGVIVERQDTASIHARVTDWRLRIPGR